MNAPGGACIAFLRRRPRTTSRFESGLAGSSSRNGETSWKSFLDAALAVNKQPESGVIMRVMRPRNSGVLMGLAAALLSGSGAARADIIYQTGFESPTYTVGTLNGQDGWNDDPAGVARVETSTVLSGSRAMSVNLDSSPSVSHNLVYDSTTNPAAIVRLQIAFQMQGNMDSQAEGLALFGDGGFVAQLIAEGGSFDLAGAPGSDTGDLPAALGVWYSLEMDLDFQTQTVTANVNGMFQGTVAMAEPTTSLVDLALGGSGGTGETVFYDDFSASVATPAPEPSSLTLIAMGGVSLTGWRRWKARRTAR
jgi:hypothetical protein